MSSNGVESTPTNANTVSGPGGAVATASASASSSTSSSSYLRLMQNEQARHNIQNISRLLNTGLSDQTLDICVKLCEAGVHPQSLAEVVRQLRNADHP